jgi:hypothetical protein
MITCVSLYFIILNLIIFVATQNIETAPNIKISKTKD